MGLDRGGKAPAQPRFGGFLEAAELENQAPLGSIDDIEPGSQPHAKDQHGQNSQPAAQEARIEIHLRHARTTAIVPSVIATALVAEHAAQALVEIAPQLFEIGRPLIGFARTAAVVGVAIILVTTPPPLRVVDRHENTKSRNHMSIGESVISSM